MSTKFRCLQNYNTKLLYSTRGQQGVVYIVGVGWKHPAHLKFQQTDIICLFGYQTFPAYIVSVEF